jgi:hypothetical protein
VRESRSDQTREGLARVLTACGEATLLQVWGIALCIGCDRCPRGRPRPTDLRQVLALIRSECRGSGESPLPEVVDALE